MLGCALGLVALLVTESVAAQTPVLPMPRVELRRGSEPAATVSVELADEPHEWSVGLSGRSSLAADAGMLFVFPHDVLLSFWMRDTDVPLSIAFIDADGTILDIQDMAPRTTTLHSSPLPYRAALEVNQGYFVRADVRVGNDTRAYVMRQLLPVLSKGHGG